MRLGRARFLGSALLLAAATIAALSASVATQDPRRQFPDFVFAPPMPPRLIDPSGQLRAPFVYPLRLDDRLERRYSEDRGQPVRLRWFANGRIVSVDDAVWFPLGTDALGRDVFARLVWGARLSLGVAVVSVAGALIIGAAVGGIAGAAGGPLDGVLMRVTDFVVALPGIYVVLTLRAALPLVLTTSEVFWTLAVVFAAIGWPLAARGVRAIVAVEKSREYAEAAKAIGVGSTRLLLRHLLPATRGFLATQATLLLPAFILAEATLSFVGLGFADASPSWGVMLQEAGAGATLAEAPWLLAPAAAISLTVLAINLVAGRPAADGLPLRQAR